MFKRYQNLLARRPILTNMVQTGFLFGTGDCLAQKLFPHKDDGQYDYERTLRAIVYGGIIFAPVGHQWYVLLSKFNPSRSKMVNTICKVGLDQLGFAPIIGIPMYYSVMTILEQKPIESIETKLRQNWWPTLRNNWLIWPGFQLFNFYVIPLQYRLLVVNILSIGWNTYLSYELNKKSPLIEGDINQLVLAEPIED